MNTKLPFRPALWVLAFLLISMSSCEKIKDIKNNMFNSGEKTENASAQLDSYPLFEQCKSVKNKIIQKKCFQDAIYTYYKTHLESLVYQAPDSINEKVILHLEIDKDKHAHIIDFEASDELLQAFPDLKAHLESITADLEITAPAMSGNQPVSTRYKLPIHFKSE